MFRLLSEADLSSKGRYVVRSQYGSHQETYRESSDRFYCFPFIIYVVHLRSARCRSRRIIFFLHISSQFIGTYIFQHEIGECFDYVDDARLR